MGLLKLQNTLLKNNLYINIVYRYCIDISQYFPPIYRYVKCTINDSSTFSHCSSLRRSACKIFASDRELMQRYIAVSSAKSLTLDLTCSERSFMYDYC